ncbi:nucleoid-associated protein, YbaB/EbfC family [bacterium]|nr:nucleoid-associated protein, YbaB/EbfC family [bacterium]|tara:strand:+ start:403 stop:732 length:330 start_codon:yes stop_codon:yes gene_type:complete
MLDNFKNKMGDMKDIMAKAKELKESLKNTKKELESMILDIDYKNRIRIKINGEMSVQDISINPKYLSDTDIKKLESDLIKAINQATDAAKKEANTLLSKATGGLNLPGL